LKTLQRAIGPPPGYLHLNANYPLPLRLSATEVANFDERLDLRQSQLIFQPIQPALYPQERIE